METLSKRLKSYETRFGLLFGALLLVACVFQARADRTELSALFAVLGVALGVVGFFWPTRLAPLAKAWQAVGHLIGKITNPIFMGALFYLVLTPMAMVLRALGKDPLRLKRPVDKSTFWIDVDQKKMEEAWNMADQF